MEQTEQQLVIIYVNFIKTAGSSNPIPLPEGATVLVYSNGTDARLDMMEKGNFAITSSSKTAYTAVAGDNLL